MDRPRLSIKKTNFDKILEYVTFLGFVMQIVLPTYYYSKLPNQIPTHFGGSGLPDKYGDKSTLWILPLIGVVVCIGLYVLSKYPHIFNYSIKISKENALNQYTRAVRLLRTLNLVIVGSFVYILYHIISVAMENSDGLGVWFLPIFIGMFIVVILYYLIDNSKTK